MVEAPLRTFLIEARAEGDVLLRVLGPFAVQGARIRAMEASEGAGGLHIRIETAGIGANLAEHVVGRLRAMPAVTTVGLGWRAMT
jgi:hypothetical protein